MDCDLKVNFDKLFVQFPISESDTIVLRRIIEDDLKGLYEIYSDEEVFTLCGIIPKKNIETVYAAKPKLNKSSRMDSQKKEGHVKSGLAKV